MVYMPLVSKLMPGRGYQKVNLSETRANEKDLEEPSSPSIETFDIGCPRRSYRGIVIAFIIFLLGCNVGLASWVVRLKGTESYMSQQLDSSQKQLEITRKHMHEPKSVHANLVLELEDTIYKKTPFANSDDIDTVNAQWEAVNIDAGVVALEDEYAASFDIPLGQRFPWDDNKGLYLLNGYHHLHCLKGIYMSLREYKEGRPQSRGEWHAIHCLDALRREVLCQADDTPRASIAEYAPNTGVGQYRKCRDWSKLEDWAKTKSACFSFVPLEGNMTLLDRYRFCPEDSPYYELAQKRSI